MFSLGRKNNILIKRKECCNNNKICPSHLVLLPHRSLTQGELMKTCPYSFDTTVSL